VERGGVEVEGESGERRERVERGGREWGEEGESGERRTYGNRSERRVIGVDGKAAIDEQALQAAVILHDNRELLFDDNVNGSLLFFFRFDWCCNEKKQF
jgi:hypothetical protein